MGIGPLRPARSYVVLAPLALYKCKRRPDIPVVQDVLVGHHTAFASGSHLFVRAEFSVSGPVPQIYIDHASLMKLVLRVRAAVFVMALRI